MPPFPVFFFLVLTEASVLPELDAFLDAAEGFEEGGGAEPGTARVGDGMGCDGRRRRGRMRWPSGVRCQFCSNDRVSSDGIQCRIDKRSRTTDLLPGDFVLGHGLHHLGLPALRAFQNLPLLDLPDLLVWVGFARGTLERGALLLEADGVGRLGLGDAQERALPGRTR